MRKRNPSRPKSAKIASNPTLHWQIDLAPNRKIAKRTHHSLKTKDLGFPQPMTAVPPCADNKRQQRP